MQIHFYVKSLLKYDITILYYTMHVKIKSNFVNCHEIKFYINILTINREFNYNCFFDNCIGTF